MSGVTYFSMVGESFMNVFILAYSDLKPDQSSFSHKVDSRMAQQIRSILTPGIGDAPFFAVRRGKAFHDQHHTLPREITYASYNAAMRSGRQPCRICKPGEEVG